MLSFEVPLKTVSLAESVMAIVAVKRLKNMRKLEKFYSLSKKHFAHLFFGVSTKVEFQSLSLRELPAAILAFIGPERFQILRSFLQLS